MSHVATFLILQQRREQKEREEDILRWLKNMPTPYPLIYRILGDTHIPTYYKEWENRFYRSREDFYNHFDRKHKDILYKYYQHDIRH